MIEFTPPTAAAGRPRARQGAATFVVCAAMWAALTGADPASLAIGAPTVALAVAASLRADASPPVRLLLFARFLPYLLGQVFAGAWSVARRSLSRHPRFDPGEVSYRLGLRSGPARSVFMMAVTVTPGTLSAQLDGDRLLVHALDRGADVRSELSALESRVAALFDEPWKPAR